MRITMKTGGAPSACEENFNGEVEDYNVGYGADLFIPVVNKMELSIYPNPADNILNIAVSGNREYVNVKIYSAIGNLMQSFQMNDRLEQINLDAYRQGLYFIHVNDGNETLLHKFIVINTHRDILKGFRGEALFFIYPSHIYLLLAYHFIIFEKVTKC